MIPATTTSVGGALAQPTPMLAHATAASHVARQLWNLDTASSTSFSFSHCTPFALPSRGLLEIGGQIITITADATFQPECTGTLSGEIFSVADLRDPFYASTIPQTYVIGASTVIAWILVTMLVITPRTSFLGAPSTSAALLHGHGIIGGASGGISSLTGAGSRPWLQKLATLTAAISLTIATADTFRAANYQYQMGFMDAEALRVEVLGSLEIRIVRVISDIFLWLAQVQTLIRLFPRHKEKVLIKWIGFALIVLDTIFSCLNSFMVNGHPQSPHFDDAIPALSYLFELALGLLYAAWVIYYALTKRRYAFFHPRMRNICIIAILSIVAISTPVTFFITDVSDPDVAGWGDYVRWVGAGAASVVVWEWVERIEALERDEKKDDILGREVFDGDEMLDVAPSEEAVWSPSRSLGKRFRRRFGDDRRGGDPEANAMEQGLVKHEVGRYHSDRAVKQQNYPSGHARYNGTPTTTTTDPGQSMGTSNGNVRFRELPTSADRSHDYTARVTSPPYNSQTPISRADTTSAASTVYVVRYHQPSDIPQPVQRDMDRNRITRPQPVGSIAPHPEISGQAEKETYDEEPDRRRTHDQFWQSVPNPFKRKRASPPKEVQQARAAAHAEQQTCTPRHNFARWDVVNRLGVLAAETGDRFRDRSAGQRPRVELPVTVIPAQPRGSGRMWSPANLESNADATTSNPANTSHVDGSSGGSTTLVNSQSDPSQVTGEFGDDPRPMWHSTTPRADQLAPAVGPTSEPATIVVPAPERRSPSGRRSPAYWNLRNGSVASSGHSSSPHPPR